MKKKVIIYIDVMERYRFFRRFFHSIKLLGYKPFIVTGKLSIYIQVKRLGIECKLLTKHFDRYSKIDFNLQNSLSVLNHYHTLEDAFEIYSAVQKQFLELTNHFNIEVVFIWNGSTTIAKALSEFAKNNDIKTCYFEISNLGSKIFVDKEGVNAQSFLAQNISILDDFDVEDQIFFKWRSLWREQYKIPKQVKNTTHVPLSFIIDWLGFYFFNALREDKRSSFMVLKKKYMLKKNQPQIKQNEKLPQRYIFFAMQVSDDSQLMLNSDLDNLQALAKVKEMAKEEELELVVKLHPAESNYKFIRFVVEDFHRGEFILSSLSTKDLIRFASKVVVINSTVGLEALIEEKDVIVLGRALYKSFNFRTLKAYIFHYLIEIDYFNDKEEVSTNVLKKVLARYE